MSLAPPSNWRTLPLEPKSAIDDLKLFKPFAIIRKLKIDGADLKFIDKTDEQIEPLANMVLSERRELRLKRWGAVKAAKMRNLMFLPCSGKTMSAEEQIIVEQKYLHDKTAVRCLAVPPELKVLKKEVYKADKIAAAEILKCDIPVDSKILEVIEDSKISKISKIPEITEEAEIIKDSTVVPQPEVSGLITKTDPPLSRGQKKKLKMKAMKAKDAPLIKSEVVEQKISEPKEKMKKEPGDISPTPPVANIPESQAPTQKIPEVKAPPKSVKSSNKLAAPAKQFKKDDVEAPKIIKSEDPPKSSVKVATPPKQIMKDDVEAPKIIKSKDPPKSSVKVATPTKQIIKDDVDAQKRLKDQIQIDLQEVRAKKVLDQQLEDERLEKVQKAILAKASKPRFQQSTQSVKTNSNSQKKKNKKKK